MFIRSDEISGDPSLNLKLGDVLYGIPIIVEAINEKDAEYKAIKEFKDNFYTIDKVLVTHLLEEWWQVNLIKPCPFCGGRADMRYSFDKALIECTNTKCKIQPSTWLRVKTDSVNKLVKIWNTRNYEEDE